MLRYKPDFEQNKARYDAFWNKDFLDRCCLAIQVPKPDAKPVFPPRAYTPQEQFADAQCMHEIMINRCEETDFLYESLPAQLMYFGTGGQCEYFGCKPYYADGTIWFPPILDEPDSSRMQFDEAPFLRHKALTKRMVELSNGLYFTAMNDNCGIIDALAELRGTQNLLFDMIENPEFVHEARDKITDVWKKTQTEFFELIKENNLGGSCHAWMHVWTPERHLQLQCDYSCMISPAMFEEFVLPELEATSSAFEHASYHLDGIEQLRHLDLILSVKGIDNIQWTHVAGQPKTSVNIEALQKIQKAGKGLILFPHLDEVEFLLKNLSHQGLQLVIGGVKDREEAADIERLARKLAH